MAKKLGRTLDATALYAQLGRLIQTMPNLERSVEHPSSNYRLPNKKVLLPLSADDLLWLGRAEALVEEALGVSGSVEFRSIMNVFDNSRGWAAKQIPKLMYRALAQAEMELPVPQTGAFIPAGSTFDALKAIQRIFGLASTNVMVADPYLDETFVLEYAAFVPVGVETRLLTKRANKRPGLAPALKSWRTQHPDRPVIVRSTTSSGLHDRAIFVDTTRAWTMGQSFNKLAVSASTTFVEVIEPDTRKLKIEAHEEMWNDAEAFEV